MRSSGSPALARRDDLAAVPGAHLWLVSDGPRLLGAVARLDGWWTAGTVGPLRSRRWIGTTWHRTRAEAVARLAGGVTA